MAREQPRGRDGKTFAERFKEAIEAWQQPNGRRGSVLGLSKVLAKHPIASRTRRMLQHYLSQDGPIPDIQFISNVAEVLGVRARWLQSGQGEMTEEAERLAKAQKPFGEIVARFPPLGRVSAATMQSVFAFYEQFARTTAGALLSHTLTEQGQDDQAVLTEIAHRVGSMLQAPADTIGIDLLRIERWQLDRYIELILQAYRMLLVKPGEVSRFLFLKPMETADVAKTRSNVTRSVTQSASPSQPEPEKPHGET